MLSLSVVVWAAMLAPDCRPVTVDASVLLRRVATALRMDAVGQRVLRQEAVDVTSHPFESDRPYPPFLMETSRVTEWLDVSSGAVRTDKREGMIGGYQFPASSSISTTSATFVVQDTSATASPETHWFTLTTRPLNAWAVVDDWHRADDVRAVERCEYRGFPRIVLTRRGYYGAEQLLLDEKTSYPVALRRREPHYLWGQVDAEYVYATWQRVGDGHVPGTASRVVDGETEITRSFGQSSFVSRDSAPSFKVPATRPMRAQTPAYLDPVNPDTLRVSANSFLLRNAGYTELVTLQRDTVYLFDPTQGETRARLDSTWIRRLFPGEHAVVVIVTDLAWPHLAGVRFWVASGATIVSHRASRPFIGRVLQRRWTLAPDKLEQRRGRGQIELRFRSVDDSLRAGDGALTVFAINGPASEGALAAFIHDDRFLWASDYVQTLRAPSHYLDEMVAAVRRHGYQPTKLGAEHIRLSDWSAAERLAESTARPAP